MGLGMEIIFSFWFCDANHMDPQQPPKIFIVMYSLCYTWAPLLIIQTLNQWPDGHVC